MVARPFPKHLLVLAVGMFVIVSLFGTQLFVGGEWRATLRYQLLLSLWAVMAMSVVFAAAILGWSRLAYGRTGTAVRHQVEAEIKRISSPSLAVDRLFVVRAQGDEAAALLGAAQLSAWVFESLLSSQKLLVRLLLGAVALSALLGVVLVLVGGGGLGKVDSAMGWGFYMVSTVLIIAGALLVLTYLPFGADLLFWALFANITAGPSPMGHGGKSYQAHRADAGGLSHKVYADPGVIEAVVEWIEG
jgi:hypothetical protein